MKLRIAPSPTGKLHIGNARTALFNWLYAKANNGTFLVRIDDTDTERSTEEFKNDISGQFEHLLPQEDHNPLFQVHPMSSIYLVY